MKNHLKLMYCICVLFISTFYSGQKTPSVNYSLFNPVPKHLLREMETDRPDITESPHTVDAGHIQYETDVLRLIKEKTDSQITTTTLINQGNIKIGITNSTAIQIGFESYGEQENKDILSGNIEKKSGIGDINFRIKQNIVGNNSGKFALAILPLNYQHQNTKKAGLKEG